MLTGRRYLLALTPEQEVYAEQVGAACRAVWNTALEQRRECRRRGAWINYVEQARQMAEAKKDPYCAWLADAPSCTLQQTLRDLEKACKAHGAFKVRWRSKARSAPSFRFPDPNNIVVRRLTCRLGKVKLPKFGWVKFRWSRPLGGTIRNATVLRNGGRWYISFCVEDGVTEVAANGKLPVGVDRGVKVAIATSDGMLRDRGFVTSAETKRLKRLQQQLARQKNKRSNRRKTTRAKITTLNARIRNRRTDFAAWTANKLTRDHGLVVVEDLKVANMVRSAKGTIEAPGKNVRAKTGLNRSIMNKGWGGFLLALEHKARYNGSQIVKVNPAYTSQTCNACKHVARENRESQAVFRCVACRHQDNADVNAARNILAAGLAVTGRGDLDIGRSVKRQPPVKVAA
jgi:IS605 OrfB family transposase